MYKHGVLTHFYQQDIEPINEAAERLGIPLSEFIRQACRTFINTMNDSTPPKRLSSPNVNVKLNEVADLIGCFCASNVFVIGSSER